MKEIDYINDRLEDQIEWYDKKSLSSQRIYKWAKGTEIVLAAFIPVVSLSLNNVSLLVSVMGALIAIIEGILNIGKYHENWIEYRSICETLKHEKFMYQTKSGVYKSDEDTFKYLVMRVESIISKENVNWASMHRKEKEG